MVGEFGSQTAEWPPGSPSIHCPPQIKGLSASHDHLLTELTGLAGRPLPVKEEPTQASESQFGNAPQNAFKGH